MASPVKNLVDATTYSAYPLVFLVTPRPIILKNFRISLFSQIKDANTKGFINYFMNDAVHPVNSATERWMWSPLTSFPNLKIPCPIVGFDLRTALPTTVITFPSIYKERGGARLSEGQIFPTGLK